MIPIRDSDEYKTLTLSFSHKGEIRFIGFDVRRRAVFLVEFTRYTQAHARVHTHTRTPIPISHHTRYKK